MVKCVTSLVLIGRKMRKYAYLCDDRQKKFIWEFCLISLLMVLRAQIFEKYLLNVRRQEAEILGIMLIINITFKVLDLVN